jgi:gas vesicle protein
MKNQHSEDGIHISGLIGFFVGFLSGGLIGALVMLLLAPRAGKKTRAKIQKKGAKLRRQATRSVEDAVTEAGDMAHQFTDDVQAGVHKSAESVENSLHKGVSDLQQRGQELLAEVKK